MSEPDRRSSSRSLGAGSAGWPKFSAPHQILLFRQPAVVVFPTTMNAFSPNKAHCAPEPMVLRSPDAWGALFSVAGRFWRTADFPASLVESSARCAERFTRPTERFCRSAEAFCSRAERAVSTTERPGAAPKRPARTNQALPRACGRFCAGAGPFRSRPQPFCRPSGRFCRPAELPASSSQRA